MTHPLIPEADIALWLAQPEGTSLRRIGEALRDTRADLRRVFGAPRAPAAVPEEVLEACWSIANQLHGYVDPSTPQREAEFMLRIAKEAGALGKRLRALAAAPAAPPADGGTEGLREAFLEGYDAACEDTKASSRPIVGGYGVNGPQEPEDLWKASKAYRVSISSRTLATRPASPAPVASAGGPLKGSSGAEYQADMVKTLRTAEPGAYPATAKHLMLAAADVLEAALAPAAQINPGREEIGAEDLAKALCDVRGSAYQSDRMADGSHVSVVSGRAYEQALALLNHPVLAARPVAEGDADWQPGMLVRNARHDADWAYPAFGETAYIQGIEQAHGTTYLRFGPSKAHTYLAEMFDVVPAALSAPSPTKGGTTDA